jgi:sugar lactone lactonase YvrE
MGAEAIGYRGGGLLALRAVALALVLSVVGVASASAATYGTSIGSYGSEDGQFSHPAGLALDTEGNLWVADQGNNRVQKFNEAGEYVFEFGSHGSGSGAFDAPKAVAIEAEGNIWVADSGNNRLEKFDAEGKFIEAVGSAGSGNGKFSGPEDVAIDAEGNIWVADTYNYRVQELDAEGKFIKVVNPEGLGAIEPTGIDIGPGGKAWVTDWAHDRVVELSNAGALLGQFGSSGSGNGEFSHPDGIDVDSEGNVWVGDEGNSRVQEFNEGGEYLDQFGTSGSGEGEFSFSYPFGIVADSGTSIWVADSSNGRVQKWSTSPIPSCHAGSASTEENEPLVLEAGALECIGEAPLEYEIVSGPEHGEISGFDPETGALTYTPDSEFTGLDSFTFKATNGFGSSAVKAFTVAVGEVAICHDGEGMTAMGEPLHLEAGALECIGEAPLEYEIVSGPEHGEISGFDPETGVLTYTPEPEYSGPDSFTFRAANLLGPSATQTFQISVQGVPICHAGSASTEENEPLVLEAGALECIGEAPLEYKIVSGPEHGEISEFDPETGALTYTPETGFGGYDSFHFRAINGVGPASAKAFEIEVGESTAGTPEFQLSFGHYGSGGGNFQIPTDVAVDEKGHVFVLDGWLNTIQKFTERGQFIEEFGGYGSGNGDLINPSALAVDGNGDLWVADSGNDRIEELGPEGEYLDQFGSSGGGADGYSAYWEGHGHFKDPGGIAVDAAGDIYVSDSGNHRIQKFDDEGNFLAVYQIAGEVGPGEFVLPETPQAGEDAPAGIGVGPNGDVWFAERANAFGSVTRLSSELEYLGAAEYAPEGGLGHPEALDVDLRGNIWVGDAGHDRIVEFNRHGKFLNAFGKWSGYPGGNFDFGSPFGHFGLDVDAHNRIWVADENDFEVQRWVEHKGQAAVCEDRDAITPVDQPLYLTGAELGCEGEAPLEYEVVSGPEHGEISEFDPEAGTLTYAPDSEYIGFDSLVVNATNGLGAAEAKTLTITVGDLPICSPQETSTAARTAVPVALECQGSPPLEYEVVSGPEHGEISEFDPEAGTLTYTPESSFSGIDEFRFRATNTLGVSPTSVAEIEVDGPEPVAAYSFDEGEGAVAHDLFGGHDGAVEGEATWVEGRYGGALEFDGEDDQVTVPDSGELNLGEGMTLEAWVRPDGSSFPAPILAKEDSDEESPFGYLLYGRGEGEVPSFLTAGEEGEPAEVEGESPLPANRWTFFAVTSDNEESRIYRDGYLDAVGPALPVKETDGDLRIGADDFLGQHFSGRIDEVRIYEGPISHGQIEEDQEEGIESPGSGEGLPVASYALDEGEGSVAQDPDGEHEAELEGPEWTEGIYGNALQFDGEGDCLTVPASLDLELRDDFTLEAWVKPAELQTAAPIFYKSAASSLGYALYAGGPEEGHAQGLVSRGSEAVAEVVSSEALPEEEWSHVALRSDGTDLRLYVDGRLEDSVPVEGTQGSTGPLHIGCNSEGEEFFAGAIDQVRIYNRALTKAEIEADSLNDFVAPEMELSGPLTEGVNEESTEYALEIHATDGKSGQPGTGVVRTTVEVDEEVAYRETQSCPGGNCSMNGEWVYDASEYEDPEPTVSVSVEDSSGNTTARSIRLVGPDGDLAGCPLSGEASSVPSEEEELPGGGSTARYTLSDGTQLETPEPPAEFDLTTASNEELEAYGFEPRPSEPEAEAEWLAEYEGMEVESGGIPCNRGAAKLSVEEGEEHEQLTSLRPPASGPPSLAPLVRSSLYSGYGAVNYNSTELLDGIKGEYVQAQAHQDRCNISGMSSWVGIGAGSGKLIQSGTILYNRGHVESIIQLWKGYGPGEHHNAEIGMHVVPGDRVHIKIVYQPTQSRAVIVFSIERTVKGKTYKKGISRPVNIGPAYYQGNQIEWFEEKPADFAGRNLKNFGTVPWTHAQGREASSKSWVSLGDLYAGKYVIQPNKAAPPLTKVSGIGSSGEGFIDHWRACRQSEGGGGAS